MALMPDSCWKTSSRQLITTLLCCKASPMLGPLVAAFLAPSMADSAPWLSCCLPEAPHTCAQTPAIAGRHLWFL